MKAIFKSKKNDVSLDKLVSDGNPSVSESKSLVRTDSEIKLNQRLRYWKRAKTAIKISIGVILLLLGLVMLILVFIPNSPVQDLMLDALEKIEGYNKVVGCIIIGSSYSVALLFMLPGTPWNLAAGYLYGVWIGSLVALIGVNIGAFLAFYIGRFVLRSWAESLSNDRPFFKSLDKAIAKHGFKLILMTRLSPILPFSVLNYLFGVTPVGIVSYEISTLIGVIPLTMLYCWVGSTLRDLKEVFSGEGGEDKTETIIVLVAAVTFTILSMVVITLITRSAIKNALTEVKTDNNNAVNTTTEPEPV